MSLPLDFRGKLYLIAALVGILTGLLGGAFHALLDGAEHGRQVLRSALADAPVPGWLILMVLGPLVLMPAMWLVRRFAPETAGSGIQEVEAILAGHKFLNWRRVLPVKFVAGTLAVGSGLVLGREGPTVHIGAALGKMASDWGRLDARQTRALISAGAAAGLAAAFNAPLAAIVFITEELRDHFEYGFASLQSVILAACMAVVVSDGLLGQGPSLPVDHLHLVPLASLPDNSGQLWGRTAGRDLRPHASSGHHHRGRVRQSGRGIGPGAEPGARALCGGRNGGPVCGHGACPVDRHRPRHRADRGPKPGAAAHSHLSVCDLHRPGPRWSAGLRPAFGAGGTPSGLAAPGRAGGCWWQDWRWPSSWESRVIYPGL